MPAFRASVRVRIGGVVGLIEQERHGAVQVLWLNRPERKNALSNALISELLEALTAASEDAGVHCVVLSGRGTVFCAGGDLADGMTSGGEGVIAAHEGRGAFAELLREIPMLRMPVIAALQGDALGGGCGLAASCDLVVADEEARLGTPEIRLGLFPWIILAALQRDVPRKRLLEMALTGEKISSKEAQNLGLVNRVASAGTTLDEALKLAQSIASRSPLVVKMGKRAFHHISDHTLEDGLDYMQSQLTLNLLTEDAMEGVSAFLTRREPSWKGR